MIYYSKSTGGFYFGDFHKEMPDDVVEITNDLYKLLMLGVGDGRIVVADDNGNPILQDLIVDFPTLKQNKINDISAASQVAANALISGYPEFEKLSWPTQQKESEAWFAASASEQNETLVPWCAAAAKVREIELVDFMLLVKNNINAFVIASASIAGKRQKLTDQVNTIVDDTQGNRDALNAIAWSDDNV